MKWLRLVAQLAVAALLWPAMIAGPVLALAAIAAALAH